MMVNIHTHPVVRDIQEEYHMNWCGRLMDVKPKLRDGKPLFIIIGSKGRMELNTIDMNWIEDTAKSLTYPRGRSSFTSDEARIYIREENGKDRLMGILTHNHIKTYNQIYDSFEYR